MKTCTKCKVSKEPHEFGKHKHTRDGLNSWCKQCSYERTRKWKAENPEWQQKYNKKRKARYRKDPEFKAKCNQSSKNTYHNKHKNDAEYMERMYEKKREYVAQNLDKYNAWTADYRQRKRHSAKHMTDLDKFVIGEAYKLAKEREQTTGIAWHVDHIVPLRGETVCGLHVASNIQVIPAKQNLVKGNKLVLGHS